MKATINGKEYNLFYSVGAHVAFDNWAVSHPKASFTEGIIQKFIMMCIAYNDAFHEKQETPKKEEIALFPNSVFEEIAEAVNECEKADTERKVEAEIKNGKSAGR